MCASHLKDKGFASPVIDEKAEAEKKKQEALAKEKEAVIKEYEEKMKKKGKDVKKKEDATKTAEEEKDQKVRAIMLSSFVGGMSAIFTTRRCAISHDEVILCSEQFG